ncbi:hypothetical protein ERJ75_000293100 [Trypanosoma vivax]|nr:hypothetical protein ERJ75_000293100 [Trypanosoma vivax]
MGRCKRDLGKVKGDRQQGRRRSARPEKGVHGTEEKGEDLEARQSTRGTERWARVGDGVCGGAAVRECGVESARRGHGRMARATFGSQSGRGRSQGTKVRKEEKGQAVRTAQRAVKGIEHANGGGGGCHGAVRGRTLGG